MTTIIDPTGDVVLTFGNGDPTELRVSSKVLSVASPVFAALFGPRFKEGSDLRASFQAASTTTQQPLRLPLVEDDPEAMRLLCSTLHYRQTATPNFEQLKMLALVCDKYDCREAVMSHSTLWLQSYLASVKAEGAIDLDALAVSYIFGNAWAFAEITRRLLREHTGPYVRIRTSVLQSYLPDSLLGQLHITRALVHSTIAASIEKPISTILAKVDIAASKRAQYGQNTPKGVTDHSATKFCLFDSLRLSFYMRELHRIRVYPWPAAGTVSLSDILLCVANYSEYDVTHQYGWDFPNINLATLGFLDKANCVAGCACQADFKEPITSAIQTASSMLQGFALNQYRNTATATTDDSRSNAKRKRGLENLFD